MSASGSAAKRTAGTGSAPTREKPSDGTVYLPITQERKSGTVETDVRPVSEPVSRREVGDPVEVLKEIHAVQLDILKRGDRLSLKEYNAEAEKILMAVSALEDADGSLVDLPFFHRMADMNRVLKEIRSGFVKSFSAQSKTDEQLLREIQQAQLNWLSRSAARAN